MSILNRLAAALATGTTDFQRAHARERLIRLANSDTFVQDIIAQHRQIEGMFAKVRTHRGPAARDAVRQLAIRINAHAMAKEAVIYPELAESGNRSHAAIAYEQQAAIKIQLAALQKHEPGTDEWQEAVEQVKSAMQQHVFLEESVWLPDTIRYVPVEIRRCMSAGFRDYCRRFDIT